MLWQHVVLCKGTLLRMRLTVGQAHSQRRTLTQRSVLQAEASTCNSDTTPTQPHRNSNTHRTKNNTTNVVIQQNSRKLLMMDILMSETCWAHKKWNKIASVTKLVFYSSIIVPSMSSSTKRYHSLRSPHGKPNMQLVRFSYVPHTLPITLFFTWPLE